KGTTECGTFSGAPEHKRNVKGKRRSQRSSNPFRDKPLARRNRLKSRGDRRRLRAQVVAEQPRPVDASHLARVLRDVEQSTTEHRQRPRFSCGEQPGARDLLVALRRQLEPQQVSELTETEICTIGREQRSAR